MGYKTVTYGKRASHRNYSKMLYDIDLPNLIEIQTSSFQNFIDESIGETIKRCFTDWRTQRWYETTFRYYYLENLNIHLTKQKCMTLVIQDNCLLM